MSYRMTDAEKQMLERRERERERKATIDKIALTLLAQCQSENVTITELETIIAMMMEMAKESPVLCAEREEEQWKYL